MMKGSKSGLMWLEQKTMGLELQMLELESLEMQSGCCSELRLWV